MQPYVLTAALFLCAVAPFAQLGNAFEKNISVATTSQSVVTPKNASGVGSKVHAAGLSLVRRIYEVSDSFAVRRARRIMRDFGHAPYETKGIVERRPRWKISLVERVLYEHAHKKVAKVLPSPFAERELGGQYFGLFTHRRDSHAFLKLSERDMPQALIAAHDGQNLATGERFVRDQLNAYPVSGWAFTETGVVLERAVPRSLLPTIRRYMRVAEVPPEVVDARLGAQRATFTLIQHRGETVEPYLGGYNKRTATWRRLESLADSTLLPSPEGRLRIRLSKRAQELDVTDLDTPEVEPSGALILTVREHELHRFSVREEPLAYRKIQTRIGTSNYGPSLFDADGALVRLSDVQP